MRSHCTMAVLALALLLGACQSDMMSTAGSDTAPGTSPTTAPKAPAVALGLPEVKVEVRGALPAEAPSIDAVRGWLEKGLAKQPEFPKATRLGTLSGSYRAKVAGASDGSGRQLVSVAFNLDLTPTGQGRATFRTEAFVAEPVESTDARTALNQLVQRVAQEATADLAKQVRVSRADSAELLNTLGETHDPVLVEFAIDEVRRRKLPGAQDRLIALLTPPEGGDRRLVNRAAGCLGDVGDEKAVGPLIQAGSRVPAIDRLPVLFALGEIGGKEATLYLETLAKEINDPQVKGAADRALKRATRKR